jgi:vitamin B12 transporter
MTQRVLLTVVLAVATGAGTAPTARSQEPVDTTVLAPVVVTATRIPTQRSALSATVTVLHGEDLRAQGIRMVADALRDVAGINVVKGGSYGSLTSVFARGGESDYVKVLVDGAPLNEPGGAINLADLTTDNVERIEIVRGPASVVYGTDAVSGVIQVFTRRGRGPLRAEANLRGGSYGSVEADLAVDGGNEAVSYSLGVSRSTTDGIHPFNSSYDNLVMSGALRVTPDARTDLDLALRYGDSEFHVATDFTGALADSNAFQHRDVIAASLDAGRFLSDEIEGRVLLAITENDGGFDDQPDGPGDTLGFFGSTSLQSVSRRSADARVNWYATATEVVTVGAEYERERGTSVSEAFSAFGPSADTLDAGRKNLGLYGQLQAAPLDGLAFTLGARLDDNSQFGTFFTYRAGATYAWHSGTRVRASLGRAFKEPTFYENFADSPFAQGNPNLDPERALSWELGVEQELWSARVMLGATYFRQEFHDLVQFVAVPPSPDAPNYFNLAAAEAAGVEILIRSEPLQGLTVGASYTYLHTEVIDAGADDGPGAGFVEGERLLRRPPHQLNADVSYRVRERGFAALRLNYVGARDDRDFTTFPATPVTLPWYVTLDVAAEATVWRGLAATLRVENPFDEQYQEVFGFAAPGRRWLVGGKLRL